MCEPKIIFFISTLRCNVLGTLARWLQRSMALLTHECITIEHRSQIFLVILPDFICSILLYKFVHAIQRNMGFKSSSEMICAIFTKSRNGNVAPALAGRRHGSASTFQRQHLSTTAPRPKERFWARLTLVCWHPVSVLQRNYDFDWSYHKFLCQFIYYQDSPLLYLLQRKLTSTLGRL